MKIHYGLNFQFMGRRIFLSIFCLFYLSFVFAQHSESMYGDEIEQGTDIYVITNRLADSAASHLQFVNSLHSVNQLSFVRATIYRADSIELVKMDSSRFTKEISSIHNDWLLFVHGDSKTFEQAIQRGLDIQYLYKVNVIVFSWPSFDPDLNGLENVKNSQQNVIGSVESFYHLLQFMDAFRQANPAFDNGRKLSLFAHSLGNYYLKNLVTRHLNEETPTPLFDNLVLNEAAVNQDNHKQWVEQLKFQKRIYITSNKKDFTLKGLQLFTSQGEQLGENVELPLADNAIYIQFTDAVGFRFPVGSTHTYFIGEVPDKSENIMWFYHELVHGKEVDLSNKQVFEARPDGLGYNIQAEIK